MRRLGLGSRLVGARVLLRLDRYDLDGRVEFGGGFGLDLVADFGDGGGGHRVGVRSGEVVMVGEGGYGCWSSGLWRGGCVVGVGDVVWFGWNILKAGLDEGLLCEVEGVGLCLEVPYERIFCGIRVGDLGIARGLVGSEGFFDYVYGVNGFCLGLPRVWDEVILESVVKRVSRDCVKLVVLGDCVEYYQGDVYVQDVDVDLVVGGWYLLDGDCDVEVEGDYARMFRFVVNGLEVGVYRFQRRNVLCRVDGELGGINEGLGHYRVKRDVGGGDDVPSRAEYVRDVVQGGKSYYFR